jgi:hypothetical protein
VSEREKGEGKREIQGGRESEIERERDIYIYIDTVYPGGVR